MDETIVNMIRRTLDGNRAFPYGSPEDSKLAQLLANVYPSQESETWLSPAATSSPVALPLASACPSPVCCRAPLSLRQPRPDRRPSLTDRTVDVRPRRCRTTRG